MSKDKRLFTAASANVVASWVNKEQVAQINTTLAQLAKLEADETEAEDDLESLQSEKEEKEYKFKP